MKRKDRELRPLIFIGTTKEGLRLGEALQQDLSPQFEVQLWTQDVFQPSHSALEDLLNLRGKIDYAALILTADDIRRSRNKQTAIPRDNLIFELGLFMGALGRDFVFAIAPKMERPELPSDLLGITTLDYTEPDRLEWRSAMAPVASRLKSILANRKRPTASLSSALASNETSGVSHTLLTQGEFPRQIAVCSIEATLNGHVPLRELNCVVACLEDAVKSGLLSIKQSVEEPSHESGSDTLSLRRDLNSFSERASVVGRGATVTVVWELPQGREGKKLEIASVILILDFVSFLQERFRRNLDNLGIHFRPHLRKVNLRTALSSGKALVRTSEFGGILDYVGVCIEEVTDLRKSVGPGGLIAHMRLAPYLFMERLCAQEGRPDCKPVGVHGDRCPVWTTDEPLRRRRPKQNPLISLNSVLDWASQPYEVSASDSMPAPLTEGDLTSVFEIREAWESRFAADLSQRICRDQEGSTLLTIVDETISQMRVLYESRSNVLDDPEWRHFGAKFHSQIAELSHSEERVQRKRFTEWVYRFTKPVYTYGMIDAHDPTGSEENVVIEEHRQIVELIRNGRAEEVRGIIKNHLVDHYDRAHEALLRCSMGSP